MKPEERWHQLIAGFHTGQISDDELVELEAALQSSAQARELFHRASRIDGLLRREFENHMPASSSEAGRPVAHSIPIRRELGWKRFCSALGGAAAGIVFGFICASMVFAVVVQERVKVLMLLADGFEDAATVRESGLPSRKDVWAGELLPPQGEKGLVRPAEGRLMAVLPPHERRRLSYAFRFFDMGGFPAAAAGQSRKVEVTARFHGETPGVRDKFQICLAAFAEDVAGAREIWTKNAMDDQALLHVTRTVKTEPDAFGWTTVRAVIDAPEGARVLLVSLAAGMVHAGQSTTEHYVDDVQVRLITSDAVLP